MRVRSWWEQALFVLTLAGVVAAWPLSARALSEASFFGPEAGPQLQQALEAAGLWGDKATLNITETTARGLLEAVPEGEQFPVALKSDGGSCSGDGWGCLCGEFPSGPPSPAVRQRLSDALGQLDCTALLLQLPGSEQPVVEEEDPEATLSLARAWPAALLVTLIALLAGLAAGVAFVRLPRVWRWSGAGLLVLAATVGALIEPAATYGLGIWDGLVAATALAVGLLVVQGGRPTWRELALLLVSIVIAAAALEGACRLLPSADVGAGLGKKYADRPMFTVGPVTDPRAELLYPEQHPEAFPERLALARSESGADGPLIVHLGDSMVHGNTVPLEETFAGIVGRLDGGRVHLNAGIQGVSTDYEYLLFQQLASRMDMEGVVLYMFAGNDIFEAGARYPFCGMDRLLDFSTGKPMWRCPAAVLPDTLLQRLAAARPPALLRALAGYSVAAQRLLRLHTALRLDTLPESKALEIIKASLAALAAASKERAIVLQVVILPDRTELEFDYEHARRRRLELIELVRLAGIEPIDAEPFLRTLTQEVPLAQCFEDDVPGDVHWSRMTHERFATWLLENVL